MLHLQHDREPPRQVERRRLIDAPNGPLNPKNSWNSFGGKAELKDNLTLKQSGLCAYCEIRLDSGLGQHVEHIWAKATGHHPELTFEYTNLMLSCSKEGNIEDVDPLPVSCGHATLKAANLYDEALFIKPTEVDCERFFSYNLYGKVIPSHLLNGADTLRAEHTIEVLNLNCRRLSRQREAVIEEGYSILTELSSDAEAKRYFLDLELNPVNGKLFSFINLRLEHFDNA